MASLPSPFRLSKKLFFYILSDTLFLSFLGMFLKSPNHRVQSLHVYSIEMRRPFSLPLQSFLLPPPHPNDVLAKIRLRKESLNSVQKLDLKEVKGPLVSHGPLSYF